MKLRVLGHYSSYPGINGGCSGYLLEGGNRKIMLDCGPGILSQLQEVCPLDSIDLIWITHLHSDHILGLFPFAFGLLSRCFTNNDDISLKQVNLYIPQSTKKQLQDIAKSMGLTSFKFPQVSEAGKIYNDFRKTIKNYPSFFSALLPTQEYASNGTMELDDIQLFWRAVEHNIPASAVKVIYQGRSIVYSGDTKKCDSLVQLAQEADVLLCEAANIFPYSKFHPGSHISPLEAGQIAAEANVNNLILTHLYQDINIEEAIKDAQKSFDGKIYTARSGASFEI